VRLPTTLALPSVFELDVYRAANADLARLSDLDLYAHYEHSGRAEGRVCSRVTDRASFVSLVPDHFRCLEIGPFDRPCLDPARTDFIDVRSTEELRERASELGLDPTGVPEIRWVSADGRLSAVEETYDLVLSSHAIEHQVDLVAHLREVSERLVPGGHYFCIIPDARYCFDHFLPLSTVADAVGAHLEGRTRHTAVSVIAHLALTCHNDAARHWAGDHGVVSVDPVAVQNAMETWADRSALIDVHAWQFSSDSFAPLMGDLRALGMIDLAPVRTYPTLRNSLEFCAVLRRDPQ
jgi:SAM-dependent methyltransferase